jgi:hypothetical protein
MPKLTRTSSGAYKARSRVPKDVADEYRRLYGQRLEVLLHIPAGTNEGKAKQRYAEWLAEHVGLIRSGATDTEKSDHFHTRLLPPRHPRPNRSRSATE